MVKLDCGNGLRNLSQYPSLPLIHYIYEKYMFILLQLPNPRVDCPFDVFNIHIQSFYSHLVLMAKHSQCNLCLPELQKTLLGLHHLMYRSQKFKLWLSYFEIYGGKLYDLLSDRSSISFSFSVSFLCVVYLTHSLLPH